MIRDKNNQCLCCSSEQPYDVTREQYDDYVEWFCGKCGRRLARGFRADHGFADGPHTLPPELHREMRFPSENFAVAEAWWTGYAIVGAIHGRVVHGSEELYNFVCSLQDTYGESN